MPTIDEAIKHQEDVAKQCHSFGYYEREEATKLLIEAGKVVKSYRLDYNDDILFQLPGETKDHCKFCGLAHTDIECPSREGEK